MTALQIQSTHTLTGKCRSKYRGIASDGLYLYCTVPANQEIHRFDKCFKNRKAYTVCRSYSSICYDICDKCFWALTKDTDSCIYQLDLEFQEIRCISLSFPDNSTRLTGISCGSSASELVISTNDFLAKLSKKREIITVIKKDTDPHFQYLCVEMLCSNYMYASCTNGHPEITLTSCTGELLLRCFLGCSYMPLDFALQCASNNCEHFQLLILVNDCNKCCHVLKCIVSLSEQKNKPQQCCTDLIESIALVEASLAHIINAEGEKLQKIIACSNDFHEIMDVNESINQTIKNVTELEKVLLEKLREAERICPH